MGAAFQLPLCLPAWLINEGVKEASLFTSAVCTWQTVPGMSALLCGSLCVCVGNSRVSKWLCYWQLSPSPWAGEAACCVGRGYTCSGLVRPQYRYTSHLRPVPSCRSANPLLGLGTESAGRQRHIYLRPTEETGCFYLLLFIYVANRQDFQNTWAQTTYLIPPACINRNLKSVPPYKIFLN